MTTVLSKSAPEAAPASKLAFEGGPKAVTASGKDRWRHVRLTDAIPILKHLWRGQTTNATGKGAIRQFENDFARLAGCEYALAMNSGTAALHSALFAVGVGPGDEVILPSYTFHASASAVLCCGAKPVFCDIDPETLTADPADIRQRITAKTKAIMVVHVWGNPAEMDRIMSIAHEYHLPVVEDCSHAHGASYLGKSVGAWGAVGCFSLQGSKAISAGEGGVAVCSDPLLYDRMLALGHPVRVASDRKTAAFDTGIMQLGPKYRPHLFGILLAHKSLHRLAALNKLRERNWDILCRELAGQPHIRPVSTLSNSRRGGYLEFKVILDISSRIDRSEYIRRICAEGVPASADRYGQLHRERIFESDGPLTNDILTQDERGCRSTLPHAESVCERLVTLPAFAKVSESYVRQCASAMRQIADTCC